MFFFRSALILSQQLSEIVRENNLTESEKLIELLEK